jgi:hypothetical protein
MSLFGLALHHARSSWAVVGGCLTFAGVVFHQRAGRHEHHRNALTLRELLHLRRRGEIVGHQVRKLRRVVRQDLGQQALLDRVAEEADAGQHHVDLHAAGGLHRFQLARQLRARAPW